MKDEYNFNLLGNAIGGIETITAAVEVQAGPNGVLEIIEQDQATQPVVNGHVNGIIDDNYPLEPQPALYDMDLEKMHIELYKCRYLTPQDFLDDVGKMVHNASVRSHEDLDRLHKAQAMFTAAQVSIQEFDPMFRQECERMAVRERQRREQQKKAKEKEKEKDDGNGNGGPVVARRSARNNGQQPELTITDPVKLERRLKRQRGEEGGADSVGSEEEAVGNNDGGRDAKRTRMVIDDDDDRDPLDIVGGTPPSQVRSHSVVRFAPDLVEPMGDLNAVVAGLSDTQPSQLDSSDHMVVDENPRRSGFDPSLLNPMSPSPPPTQHMGDSFLAPPQWGPNDNQFQPPTIDPLNPFLSDQPGPAIQPFRTPSPSRTPILRLRTPERIPTPPVRVLEPTAVPMIVVERSPSPPLPDFYVDDSLVASLECSLRDNTSTLTIEQLEQLRATCLGDVWRHRTEWNRDALVRDLIKVVHEFVEEVAEAWEDD